MVTSTTIIAATTILLLNLSLQHHPNSAISFIHPSEDEESYHNNNITVSELSFFCPGGALSRDFKNAVEMPFLPARKLSM